MKKQNGDFKSLITQRQIDELSAIYDDYLYAARSFERMIQMAPVSSIASYQMELLYGTEKPDFPWKIDFSNIYQRQKFDDFLDEKIHTVTGNAYITLRHTDPKLDIKKQLSYVPQDYMANTIDMNLPAAVERYAIVFPKNAKIGKTEFLIDGWLKATYNRSENADNTINECFSDEKVKTEFRILINLVETARANKEMLTRSFDAMSFNVFANELVAHFENTILEIMGSFAEKTQKICRKIYNTDNRTEALKQAQQDGFILSADDFIDYTNIRNLMRHQWDTIDELGYFRSSAAEKNSTIRAERLASYSKLCDKTLVQRMKSYVSVLKQMQHIMRQIKPQTFIRDLSDSNSRFVSLLKEHHHRFPNQEIIAELNYPLESDKYKSLHKNLHKIFHQIKITDDFSTTSRFDRMEEDYQRRSWFLSSYHRLECYIMTHCLTRGEDLKNKDAWDYFADNGIMSSQECKKWRNYACFRNILSHHYFNPMLRQKLRYIEETYQKDLNTLEIKLMELAPDISWIRKGVYKYTHKDGLVIILDINERKVSIDTEKHKLSGPTIKGKIDITPSGKNSKKPETANSNEIFSNGVQYKLSGHNITDMKLPNGVDINFEKGRISFGSDVQLLVNAEKFNVLQTQSYKLFTDKELHVTEFFEKNHKQPVGRGDVCLIEYKHRAMIDLTCRLKEFYYKDKDGKTLKTSFIRKDDQTVMSFADGTKIAVKEKELIVSHGNKILNYDNRQEFASSYTGSNIIPPSNSGNIR